MIFVEAIKKRSTVVAKLASTKGIIKGIEKINSRTKQRI
jgi:hypothetical protein